MASRFAPHDAMPPAPVIDEPALSGLTQREAAERLRAEGYNELPGTRRRSLGIIALEVLREPMFGLLIAAGGIYLVFGDIHEALILLSFVFVVMAASVYQQRKTERVLEALRDLTSPRALVLRDGVEQRIAGREVVRDDLLLLTEGDRVAADAVLLSCNDLAADESVLTGESMSVNKIPWDGAMPMTRPGGDGLPFVYAGSVLVQGQGVARVTATGARSEIGRIGRALGQVTPSASPLQRETVRLVRVLAFIGFALAIMVIALYGFTRHDWLGALLAGITLAMATIPEEFPVVLTVFLALGAWRISRRRVLTRHVPAIETLGAATVLCVDKTGTLTQNRMSVAALCADGQRHKVDYAAPDSLPEAFHALVEFSILASEVAPFDPMERAFHQLGAHFLADTEHLHHDWTLAHEYSLTPQLRAMSHVWQAAGRDEYVVAAKGAPEAIADLCHFDAAQLDALAQQTASLAQQGLRVLAVARADFRGSEWPVLQHDFPFRFVGLIGLADPVRADVPRAIAECREAGIRVVMITGDYLGTAQAVARQAGFDSTADAMTGDELALLDDAALQRRIMKVNVFARVTPEQKLRLVQAFKACGDVVAMTGDGVNDAPALKAAHIGIAMGARGTDVAREAADLVLLDDDFDSIVQAIRLGRRIYDNLRRAMAYILAIHVPIAGMSLIPLLFGWPLMFYPVHIVFLQFIIDPACSIVFEAEREEPDLMRRPPRDPAAPLFGMRTLVLSLLQGVAVLLIVLAVYAVALARGQGGNEARALAFVSLVVANLGLIFANRSWSHTALTTLRNPNPALWWVVSGAIAALTLVLVVPGLRALFHFGVLHPEDLLLCLAAGVASVAWFEVFKRFGRPL